MVTKLHLNISPAITREDEAVQRLRPLSHAVSHPIRFPSSLGQPRLRYGAFAPLPVHLPFFLSRDVQTKRKKEHRREGKWRDAQLGTPTLLRPRPGSLHRHHWRLHRRHPRLLPTPFKLIIVFLHETSHALACKLTCGDVESIQVHANEGGATQTCGGIYRIILPAGSGCFLLALVVVLFVAKNWLLRGLCIGFIIFLVVIWLLQETTKVQILRHVILFIGVMNSLFSVYDIYDDLISRRVHSSDAEKFAEVCPCPCNGVAWGLISFTFLCLIHIPWSCYSISRFHEFV